MTKVFILHDYKNNQGATHELAQASGSIVEYLDSFTERCKALTVELQKDIALMKESQSYH